MTRMVALGRTLSAALAVFAVPGAAAQQATPPLPRERAALSATAVPAPAYTA